jgi:Iron-sulfur cluster-binding domain
VPDPLDPFTAVSRAENLDQSALMPSALLCRSTPFFDDNTLLLNGDVLLCWMEYGRAQVLGNLLRQNWEEIHAGPAKGAVRLQAMNPSAPGSLICRRCHHAARLSQDGETHWNLLDPTLWARPRDMASGPL